MNKKDKILEKLTLTEHLCEFRKRLLYILGAYLVLFFVSYLFHEEILTFLTAPLIEQKNFTAQNKMIATAIYEPFVVYIKISAWSSLLLVTPIICLQSWIFIAPALYKQEKYRFLILLVATPLLFFIGTLMAYYIVFPNAWKFFLSFQSPTSDSTKTINILLQAKISQYLSLCMSLIFAFGACFEIPIIIIVLTTVDIVSIQQLTKARKLAIVIAFVISAIMTPPDIFSQFILAIPIIALYEISILVAKIIKKKS